MGTRMVHVGLDGIIQLKQTGDTIECFIQDINEDYTEALVVIEANQRIRDQEEVELRMFLPTERSPIKCAGNILWDAEDAEQSEGNRNFLVRIFITKISRLDGRRLDLVIAQKKALARGF